MEYTMTVLAKAKQDLINITDLKAFLRIPHDLDDQLLDTFCGAAIDYAENLLGLFFVERTICLRYPAPADTLHLPPGHRYQLANFVAPEDITVSLIGTTLLLSHTPPSALVVECKAQASMDDMLRCLIMTHAGLMYDGRDCEMGASKLYADYLACKKSWRI